MLELRGAPRREPRGESAEARAPLLPRFISLKGGEVWIGAREGVGYPDERPRFRAKVPAFELSESEVTVRQYRACVRAGVCDVDRLKQPDWGDASQCNWEHHERFDHPMNCVSWRQALDYARWVGGRLPSEAEWSFAAQGGGRAPAEGQTYPWGEEPHGCGYAVLRHQSRGEGCGLGGTAPVCSAPQGHTEQGLCDVIGNVWEWLTDEYHPSYVGAPRDGSAWALLPLDRWSTQERTLRGAAFDERDLPRIARRNHYPAITRLATVGFRVARDAAPILEPSQSPRELPDQGLEGDRRY
jgi:formylglycine-generating enzyme required for sulfatase activity